MVRLTASDFYTFYRPCECGARVYLREQEEEELPPGPYEQVLRKLGARHEHSHLETFPEFVDLSFGTLDDREARTRKEIDQGTLVIYHGLLRTRHILGNTKCEVIGEPDFLILENDGYVIRDSKISRRVTEQDHPEILRQVELYGWLFQQMFGRPPLRLEVHSGTGDIVDIHYDGGTAALKVLRVILELKQRTSEPYSPVGWTKCSGCAFNHRCWSQAEKMRDVACIPRVDQGLALTLREQGIQTVDDLLGAFDEASLAEFRRPRGGKAQRVGKTAEYVLRMARCLSSGEEVVLQTPSIPDYPNYVMFDAEGLPPQLEELDKIYLWGLQVFGSEQGEYMPAVAGFGEEGDREGWECSSPTPRPFSTTTEISPSFTGTIMSDIALMPT